MILCVHTAREQRPRRSAIRWSHQGLTLRTREGICSRRAAGLVHSVVVYRRPSPTSHDALCAGSGAVGDARRCSTCSQPGWKGRPRRPRANLVSSWRPATRRWSNPSGDSYRVWNERCGSLPKRASCRVCYLTKVEIEPRRRPRALDPDLSAPSYSISMCSKPTSGSPE